MHRRSLQLSSFGACISLPMPAARMRRDELLAALVSIGLPREHERGLLWMFHTWRIFLPVETPSKASRALT